MHQNRKNSKPETKLSEPLSLERIKLWIALTSLTAAFVVSVVSVYQSHLQSKRLQTVTVAIRDTEDIRAALRKPLEGIWQYRIDFNKFFGQEAAYISTGTAIVLWEPTRQEYQVFIGYSISREWKADEKLVTGFLGGTLRSDELGWPEEGFAMPMRYLERTGVKEFASPLATGFSFINGRYRKSPDGRRVEQVTMDYQNPRSVGTMTMSR